MKKNYQQPEIWVEKWNTTFQVLEGSPDPVNQVVRTQNSVGIEYGGEGSGPARSNGSLWDEGDEE